MKQDNYLWGCKKISNELNKTNIDIHYTTVNKIISTFRKQDLIQPNGSWKKFLKMHWDTLFAMDFMMVDTIFGRRLYLLIILELKSRKIAYWKLTENPSRAFVRQKVIDFTYDNDESRNLQARSLMLRFKRILVRSRKYLTALPQFGQKISLIRYSPMELKYGTSI